MTNREILSQYIPLIDFISEVMGPSTEVVLNDLSNPYHAVIAIRNGYLSGREIDSQATDYAIDILHSGEYRDQNYMVRYKGSANGKTFASSTYFIKNPQGELIGMLCINTDTSAAQELLGSFQRFMESVSFSTVIDENHADNPPRENLDTPIYSLANSIITKTIERYGVMPERMTRDEKIRIVQELSNHGIADIKGGIAEIARQLLLSESTVYRYLSMKNQ